MKKLLEMIKPTHIATLSLLIVTLFVRYYLFLNSKQLVREFKNQNYRELFSSDTTKLTSRLNSLSKVINWTCIEGTVANKPFYLMEKGSCESGFFQQQQILKIPQANNLILKFTIKLSKEVEDLFILFFILQSSLISTLIYATKRDEKNRLQSELKINKLARKMSHDIRSPISTLNSIIDEISNIDSESQRLLKNALIRINEISNQLLSNTQSNSLIVDLPKIENTNLNIKIKNLIELKKIEYRNTNVSIVFIENALDCISKIDPVEFERIISNLINNAIEAKAKDIIITIEFNDDNYISLQIRDNGKGIPYNLIQELGTKEISTKKTGNGLGIVHAKESIEQWNGSFNIASIINEYTEISVLLPSQILSIKEQVLPLNILLDDDELVRLTWQFAAKKRNILLKTFENYTELQKDIINIPFSSIIYVDSELKDEFKGEELALELYKLGFKNLYIASGNGSEHFKKFTFLKGVRDKSPPW